MTAVRIQTGATEPIEALIVNAAGAPITGLADIAVKIRRLSDGFYFDWSDDTFKVFASITPGFLTIPLAEISAGGSPGEYQLSSAPHTAGFTTSAITNPAANDTYRVTVIQTALTTAANVPQVGEIKEGQYVDNLDEAVSAPKTLTTAERAAIADAVLTELVSDHETALNGTESVADTLALIRKRLFNALEMTEGFAGNWVLKDDGGATLRTYDASDKGGGAIVLPAGAPAKRTKAV